MPYTVAAARAQVLDHLDDESGDRYARVSGATSYTKIDRALRSALDRCIADYTDAGGDRFRERVEVTTLATDGTASLAAYQPLKIYGVSYSPDGVIYTAIDPGDDVASYRPDLNARDLVVTLVRSFPIAPVPNEDDLLVGEVDGAARSWDAFDEWVCCRAAIQVGIKDDDKRAMLLATRDDLERSILSGPQNPKSMPWGRERTGRLRAWSTWTAWAWLYTGRTQTLQIVTNAR